MKRTRTAAIAIALCSLTASAQTSWNLNVGSEGANFNIGTTPAYIYAPQPVYYAVPVNYYYYGNPHKYNKQAKKARKQYQKAMRKAYNKGYYAPVLYAPVYQQPKAKKHHKH